MIWRPLIILLAVLIIFFPRMIGQEHLPPYWHSSFYQNVIKSLEEAGFSLATIDSIFSMAEDSLPWYPNILDRFYPKPDSNYRRRVKEEEARIFSKKSINLGKEFLKEHGPALIQLEKKSRVNKEIIVAVLRIETADTINGFGGFLGGYYTFSVFNSIILSKNASKRLKKWAGQELVAFLIICRDNKLNPLKIKGSYAGAIGFPQFMPTSYQRFAVDGNNDGVINLFDWDDAFASIANYLKRAGWRKGNSLKINQKAIYSYNHSWHYVNYVIKYARKIGFKS